MSVGLGIFLASVVALLVWQVDKHSKWRAARRGVLWVASLLVAGALAVGAYTWIESYGDDRARLKQQRVVNTDGVKEYWGLRPGMTETEVRYAKGEPTERTEKGEWVYHEEFAAYSYRIDWKADKRVSAISCWGTSGGEGILGVSLASLEGDVVEAFGAPSIEPYLLDGGTKVMTYGREETGMLLVLLEQGKVTQFIVTGARKGLPELGKSK